MARERGRVDGSAAGGRGRSLRTGDLLGGNLHGDEGAQLMLLAAVILVIGFLAVTAMVARVSLLPQETAREQGDPFPDEARAVQRAVNHTALRLDDPGTDLGGLPYADALGRALGHLQVLEHSRGFSLLPDAPTGLWADAISCSSGDALVEYLLTDGISSGAFAVQVDLPNDSCTP